MLLRSEGFNTTDSGDGITNQGMEGALGIPHVHCHVSSVVAGSYQAERLHQILVYNSITVTPDMIQLTYSPVDKHVILSVYNVNDSMLTTVDNTTKFDPEIVICAAIRMADGYIIRGHRHCHCIKIAYDIPRYNENWECPFGDDQGFITSSNRYVTREEGMKLQLAAGITSVAEGGYRGNTLFSEDLY